MYFQVKAHLLEDPKSYFRVTYDVYGAEAAGKTSGNYYASMVKYAYLYLDKVLPFTDVEIGQAHTTLLDYEESHSWAYRSIDNVFTEEGNGPGLYASAGRGFDLKTNTQYFSSEVGIYNNSGYHDVEKTTNNNGMGMDYEGRFTLHALGTGTDYKTAHTYWDASLLAKHNVNATATGNNIDAIGVHTVFNTEPLLVSAQYWSLPDTKSGSAVSESAGTGYSINAEGRMGDKDQYHAFARLDNWKTKNATTSHEFNKRTYIVGAAWDMNKNVQWQANVITYDNQHNAGNTSTSDNYNKYMLTAQVSF